MMSVKSDKIEVMINDTADEVTEELFQHLRSRYEIRLELTMKGSGFSFQLCSCPFVALQIS